MGLPTANVRDVASCPAWVKIPQGHGSAEQTRAALASWDESVRLECQRVPDGHDVHGGTTTVQDGQSGALVALTFQWGIA